MTLIELGNGRLKPEDGCPRCERDLVVGPPNHTVTAGDINEASVRPNVLCQCGAELDIQQGRVWYRGQLSFPPQRDVREVSDSLPQRVAAPIEVEVEASMSTLPSWIGETNEGEPCEICIERYEDAELPNEPCSHHSE